MVYIWVPPNEVDTCHFGLATVVPPYSRVQMTCHFASLMYPVTPDVRTQRWRLLVDNIYIYIYTKSSGLGKLTASFFCPTVRTQLWEYITNVFLRTYFPYSGHTTTGNVENPYRNRNLYGRNLTRKILPRQKSEYTNTFRLRSKFEESIEKNIFEYWNCIFFIFDTKR